MNDPHEEAFDPLALYSTWALQTGGAIARLDSVHALFTPCPKKLSLKSTVPGTT